MQASLGASAVQLQTMGSNAYRRVIERHSIATEAGKLAALFHRYASAHSAAGWRIQAGC
jgi:hypothetical protein